MTSRYEEAYRRTAAEILGQYQGQVPFAGFLKDWFKQHPKAGSRDRREIARRCYGWFRLGKLEGLSNEDRMLLAEKVDALDEGSLNPFSKHVFFPASERVSDLIDRPAFFNSHFAQPHFFLRARPGFQNRVESSFQAASLIYKKLPNDCIQLAPGTPLPAHLEADRHYVVQDWASQQTGVKLKKWLNNYDGQLKTAYDCCAASGGKTIMLHDMVKPTRLMASDVRPSIIHNLNTRLKKAGINKVSVFRHDHQHPAPPPLHQVCDLLLADVPCSGSGTWARTPEQLVFFSPEKIEHYTQLQTRILNNAVATLIPGGILYYITCSVFAAENEGQVNLLQQRGWKLHFQQYAEGAIHGADTMFMALLQKPV